MSDRFYREKPRAQPKNGCAPNMMKLAMMACGLNVTSAAQFLGVPIRDVQLWQSMFDPPLDQIEKLRLLHQKIRLSSDMNEPLDDMPEGSREMASLIAWWRFND